MKVGERRRERMIVRRWSEGRGDVVRGGGGRGGGVRGGEM